jgi:HNH endonuclease
MAEALEQIIRLLAQGRCEYCRMPESESRFPFVLDHIIARQHGGIRSKENLAFCCGRCNRFKGPNVAGIDPGSRKLTRLFNPRTDLWADHFRYQNGVLIGLTDTGRTTVAVLSINMPLRIAARRTLIQNGFDF